MPPVTRLSSALRIVIENGCSSFHVSDYNSNHNQRSMKLIRDCSGPMWSPASLSIWLQSNVNKRKEGEEETRDRRTGSSDWGNTITKQKGSQVREFRKWTSIEVADVLFLGPTGRGDLRLFWAPQIGMRTWRCI